MNASDKQAVMEIACQSDAVSEGAFEELFAKMRRIRVERNKPLFRAGDSNDQEYFILDGLLRMFVVDQDGDEVTLAFHVGPCTLTPSIARSAGGVSQVHCYALEETSVVDPINPAVIGPGTAVENDNHWINRIAKRFRVKPVPIQFDRR